MNDLYICTVHDSLDMLNFGYGTVLIDHSVNKATPMTVTDWKEVVDRELSSWVVHYTDEYMLRGEARHVFTVTNPAYATVYMLLVPVEVNND